MRRDRGPAAPGPTEGAGGSAPASSALTLRLVLAGFGILVCAAGVWATFVIGAPWVIAAVLALLAAVAVADIAVVLRRRRREGPPPQ